MLMHPDQRLSQHAEAIRAYGKRTIESMIAIGRHLTEARKLCGYGKWQKWLKREFDWGESTALRYMQGYELAAKNPKLTDLKMSSVYLLAQPSTPPTAQREILDLVAAGKKLSHKQVTTMITGHYAPKPRSTSKARRAASPKHLALVPSPTQAEIIDRIIDLFKQLDRQAQRNCVIRLRNIFAGNA
jgi:hypothetical protein